MAQVVKSRGSRRSVPYYWGSSSRITYQAARPPKAPKPSLNSTPRNVERDDRESYTGYTTPGYFKAMRSGGTLPVTPLTLTKYSFQESSGGFEVYRCLRRDSDNSWIQDWYVCTGFPVDQPRTAPYPPALPPGPVLTKAIANLRGDLWDIGTAAAEFGKTVSMVSKALVSLRRAQDLVIGALVKRKGKVSLDSPSKYLAEFSALWLEGRYGWRPLYYDMLEAQEAYNRLGGGLVVKRGASRSSASRESSDFVSIPNCAALRARRTFATNREIRAFCGGRLDLDKPVSFDPLVTGWEVIPYSFVIDWFINIGSLIQAYSPFAAGELLWSGYTSVNSSAISIALEPAPLPSGTRLVELSIGGAPTLTSSYRESVRVAAQGTLSLGFEPRLNILKGVDLAALALQAYRRVSLGRPAGKRR